MTKKRSILYFLLFAILGLLAYFPILNNQLLDFWDDQWVVKNSYTEGGINFQNIWEILTEFYHGQYSPFNEFLYLTLYSLFGYKPLAFHLASLLLHIANAFLAFHLIRRLLLLNPATGNYDNKRREIISFITALFFLIHPFNVESVAWMSASKVLVYAFFYLLASHAYITYIQKQKILYYILTIVFFLFSFWGKEQAVTFPLWIILIYLIAGYKIRDRRIWKTVSPLLVLSLFFGIITMLSQSANGEDTHYSIFYDKNNRKHNVLNLSIEGLF